MDNVGIKVQALAKFLNIAGWVVSVLGAIACFALIGEFGEFMAGVAFGCLFYGLINMLGCWVIYAIGESAEYAERHIVKDREIDLDDGDKPTVSEYAPTGDAPAKKDELPDF